jgi:eukaryotic-like serine/threonine-protein kinase
MSLQPGTRLGPYEILAPIGAGGMGEVYRARDARLGRDVAVKVLPAALSENPEALQRFEREARALAALSHPNILTLHDLGAEDGFSYAVTELLEGEVLRDRLMRTRLAWTDAVELAQAIAAGLGAAHRKGVIHRDLKPENIYLTGYGVKILDFGLARMNVGDEHLLRPGTGTAPLETQPGRLLGTVGYMSPEQARGAPPPDARSDVFSFGALFFEMLSGRRPFDAATPAETLAAILRDEPPPLATHGPTPPPILERVVRRCLEKSAEARYASGEEVHEELRLLQRPAHASARIPTPFGAAEPEGPTAVVHRSLAVLPLHNFSRDPEQEFFADAMTDALISNLARIGALKIISRTSVMRYKGSDKPLPEIARELGVDMVMEGTVVHGGSRVRISTQLIEAATDRHLWSESYERDMSDILTLQREVARAVADEIKVQVSPRERAELRSVGPVNPQAHDAFLKGWHLLHSGSASQFLKARQFLEAARETDPNYAPIYSSLTFCYGFLAAQAIIPVSEGRAMSREAAERAIALDPESAEAHLALAYVYVNYDWDWPAAERAYRRAIELRPGWSDNHHLYARLLMTLGRMEEALGEILRAQELDPLSPLIANSAAVILRSMGRFEEALEQCRRAFDLDPHFLATLSVVGGVYREMGRHEEAVEAFGRAVELTGGNPGFIANLCQALAAAGRMDEARAQLKLLLERTDPPPVQSRHFAVAYAGIGEYETALDWLEKAFEEGSEVFLSARVDPTWAPIHSHPRFIELMRRLDV